MRRSLALLVPLLVLALLVPLLVWSPEPNTARVATAATSPANEGSISDAAATVAADDGTVALETDQDDDCVEGTARRRTPRASRWLRGGAWTPTAAPQLRARVTNGARAPPRATA